MPPKRGAKRKAAGAGAGAAAATAGTKRGRGRGKAASAHETADVGTSVAPSVIEKGKMLFLYRPKVQHTGAHDVSDVQKFYILMSPETAVGEYPKHEHKPTEAESKHTLAEAGVGTMSEGQPEEKKETSGLGTTESKTEAAATEAGGTVEMKEGTKEVSKEGAAAAMETSEGGEQVEAPTTPRRSGRKVAAKPVKEETAAAATPKSKGKGKHKVEDACEKFEGHKVHRLLVIASKTLPLRGGERGRAWGFVEEVSEDIHVIDKHLNAYKYDTQTRGERSVLGARLAGEATYDIIVKNGQGHVAYVLAFPEQPSEVQQAFGIEKEGSFGCIVKNPEMPPSGRSEKSFVGLQQEKKAHFPQHLMDKFTGKIKPMVRFHPLDTAEWFNYVGTECVLFADPVLAYEIGEELASELESEAAQLEEQAGHTEKQEVKAMQHELGIESKDKQEVKEHPVALSHFV